MVDDDAEGATGGFGRSRDFLQWIVMKTATLSPFRDERTTRMLVEDVIDICVGRKKGQWHAPWAEVLKSLRGHRWSSYTLRSGRQWRIEHADERRLNELLKRQGFVIDQGDVIFSDTVQKPARPKPATVSSSPTGQPLQIATDIDAEELIDMLANEKDEGRKKAIRSKLRRMGHRGGLKNFKK